ncbi:hypothetical protein D3C76_1484510 [compost metagenome]
MASVVETVTRGERALVNTKFNPNGSSVAVNKSEMQIAMTVWLPISIFLFLMVLNLMINCSVPNRANDDSIDVIVIR